MGVAFYIRNTILLAITVFLSFALWNMASEILQEFQRESHMNSNQLNHDSVAVFESRNNNNNLHSNLGKEAVHVAFLKVHKTGSSSVQNIFLRFGESRNLTFILAHDNEDLAETKFPNMISYMNSLTDDNIVPPPEGGHYDLLCCHVIYNRTQFEKYLPKDTKYIGLVRDPITRLESAWRYFNMYPEHNLSEYAKDPLKFEKGPHSMSNNRMAFEFGYPLSLFPNNPNKPENLQSAVKEYTATVLKQFDLIMVNEKMDESLVLMQRILNWHVKDILYMKQLVAKKETRRFSEEDIKNLKPFLYLDFDLYESALSKFNEMVADLGEDFREEVEQYKNDKLKTTEFCQSVDQLYVHFEATKWNKEYNVTREDCKLFTKFEIKYIQEIRLRQYGRLGI